MITTARANTSRVACSAARRTRAEDCALSGEVKHRLRKVCKRKERGRTVGIVDMAQLCRRMPAALRMSRGMHFVSTSARW